MSAADELRWRTDRLRDEVLELEAYRAGGDMRKYLDRIGRDGFRRLLHELSETLERLDARGKSGKSGGYRGDGEALRERVAQMEHELTSLRDELAREHARDLKAIADRQLAWAERSKALVDSLAERAEAERADARGALRTALVILAVAGALIAAVLYLHERPSRDAPSDGPFAAIPGAPNHAEPLAFLPRAVASAGAGSRLTRIEIHAPAEDGTVDLAGRGWVRFVFAPPPGTPVSSQQYVADRRGVRLEESTSPWEDEVPPPRCGVAAVLRAAHATESGGTLAYERSPEDKSPVWSYANGRAIGESECLGK